jgi:hypothetical protein
MGENMQVSGKRSKRTRLIRGGRFVIEVEVEMVIPPDDLSEPCLEAETVDLLRDIAEHAERGDRDWIKQKGRVYELIGSA